MWVRKNISGCKICTEPATFHELYIQMRFTEYREYYLCYKTLSIYFKSQLCIDECIFNKWPILKDCVYVQIHDFMNILNSEPCMAKVDKTLRSLFFNYRYNIINHVNNMNFYKERITEIMLLRKEKTYFSIIPTDIIYVLGCYLQLLYHI